MSDERWVVVDYYYRNLMLAPGVPGMVNHFWVRNSEAAIRYVSADVARLAADMLLPLRPTVVRRVR